MLNKHYSYINTAIRLIEGYTGAIPLKHHLKLYFATHKKYGSKDRKQISHLCYCFFRLGWSLRNLSIEERIKAGFFLCTEQPGEWSGLYRDDWLQAWPGRLSDRITFIRGLYPDFSPDRLFPWQRALSQWVDFEPFAWSHLVQPDLFIRIRPGREASVTGRLTEAGIPFRQSGNSLALSNTSKADVVLEIDKEAVIQDINSQRTGAFMYVKGAPSSSGSTSDAGSPAVWDCCAASGGKSILAVDTLGKINLHVSDNRRSIISNLKERFKKAGIKQYQASVADLTDPLFEPPGAAYDLIIADIPCSGSGTWARTPEQLYYFEAEEISRYASLQRKILSKIVPALKPGGVLLYITCSVFKEENEEMIAFLRQEYPFRLEEMELLTGYTEKAGTLFAARLVKIAG